MRIYHTLSGCWTKHMIKLEHSLGIFYRFRVYNN